MDHAGVDDELKELEQNEAMIRRTRESIADGDRHVADSADRLVESQKRLCPTPDEKATEKPPEQPPH
jgi:hypothetical protein